ncbi:MAG: MarR family transcriptional regulator [Gammaproteobacteria bacterium]|nr:MarR family transcriptional regulator [Gammaproteobacteria bacterium]
MKHTQQGHVFTGIILEAFKVSGLLTVEGDRLTEAHGLSSARWKILGSLAISNTSLTVPQIARMMGQTRQAVQRLVDIMHKDGFLIFLSNPNHKRAKLVDLTAKGKEIYAKLEEKQIPWANQYSSQIDEVDLEITVATLKKISFLFEK